MEIKPQDLRLGNWVKHPNKDDVYQVEEISSTLTVRAIELTPEWFKRFGFTSIDGSESGHKECYSIFTFSTTGRRLPFFIGVCENGSYSPIMYHDIHEEIRYVHQLMNLFHALTGEELAIDKQISNGN